MTVLSFCNKLGLYFKPKHLVFALTYILLCITLIILLVRGAGAVTGLILGPDRNQISLILSQLKTARISAPFYIPVCGVFISYILYVLKIKRVITAVIITLILLSSFAAAFLFTRVNGVQIYIVTGVLIKLFASGIF